MSLINPNCTASCRPESWKILSLKVIMATQINQILLAHGPLLVSSLCFSLEPQLVQMNHLRWCHIVDSCGSSWDCLGGRTGPPTRVNAGCFCSSFDIKISYDFRLMPFCFELGICPLCELRFFLSSTSLVSTFYMPKEYLLNTKHQNCHFWELKEELKRTKAIKLVLFETYLKKKN